MNRCQSSFFSRTWLIQSHMEKKKQTFVDPTNPKFRVTRPVPKMKGKLCFGCFGKHLFIWDGRRKHCSFLDLTTMAEIHLPPIPVEFYLIRNFSVSLSLDRNDCIIFALGIELENPTTFVLFCRRNDKEWTDLPINLGNNSVGLNCMAHQDKLYSFTSGTVVVFDIPSLIAGNAEKKKIIGAPEFPHYPKPAARFKHLVESCGDIFLVRTEKDGPSGPLIYMHIYRLDISSEEIWRRDDVTTSEENWQRVYNIDDRAFFLEETHGISVCAKDVGVQRNCVYSVLSCYGEKRLCKFCLDDQTFTFSFLSDETMCKSYFSWILPIKSTISSNSATSCDEVNQAKEEEARVDVYRPWRDLCIDVFQFILRHLSLVDVAYLRTVCKAWRSIPNPFANVQTWPCLMSHKKINGTYSFLDPLQSTLHTLKFDELSGEKNGNENENKIENVNGSVVTICAKDGWIVMLLNNHELLIINPFSPHSNQFFPPWLKTQINGITFSSAPTSPDCIVFGIACSFAGDSVTIFLWNPETDEETWTMLEFEDGVEFHPASCNPVFFRGEFYCLGQTGCLGVFNPINKTWKILHDPKPIYPGDDQSANFYLLELQGDLICVHKVNKNMDISIFKLDQTKMAWCELKDIGDMTIFLDSRSSVAKILPNKSWNNKIFFPTFNPNSNKCAFYCMEKRLTHDSSKEFFELKQPMDCVWLERNLIEDFEA